uniref:Vacuolar protein sorting-associated protein 52 homolog n=1 Tax=Rhizochromulina marina TaxID=1034831 RepID=A0A7S2WQ93_9STRA|mmetsp:Transcript_30044/g.87500  ORF Transcript_30044/g.87500 Transcript_30044/m.87500 type:complete len:563 (+) Transcript_30044:99-1787(+)
MIESLCGPEVNEDYIAHVAALDEKLQQRPPDESHGLVAMQTVAGQELHPDMEKLKSRSLVKIREYFLSKIGELRKPKTNVQMIQKAGLLKYHGLMHFLRRHQPEIADEIRATYEESMGRTLHQLFKAYHSQLSKLELDIATKHDLIVVEEPASKSMFSPKSAPASKRTDAFSSGDRANILDSVESPPILVHVALAEEKRFPHEAILRSVLKHLMDAVTNEYLFCIDFFEDRSGEAFNTILGKTVSLILENLENYLFSCWDSIGLLIMIKLVHGLRMVMQRRHIPVLDSFFDRINLLLWPRLKVILGAQLKSIEQTSPKRLGSITSKPHPMTRRYAEFASSIFSLHGGMESLGIAGGGEDMLLNDLMNLRIGFLKLLKRMSDELSTTKEKLVFLVNNYDQVLSLFRDRHVAGVELTSFEELLVHYRSLFVEEELLERFANMITFVQNTERNTTPGAATTVPGASPQDLSHRIDLAQVEAIVRGFAGMWRSGIEAIYQDVLECFADFRNGMEILKQVLTQLLLYYTRFQEVIRREWGRQPPSFSAELVSTATILVEIKKYSRQL